MGGRREERKRKRMEGGRTEAWKEAGELESRRWREAHQCVGVAARSRTLGAAPHTLSTCAHLRAQKRSTGNRAAQASRRVK